MSLRLPARPPLASVYATSPTRLERPAFLMAFPFSYSTRVANNPWMEELPPKQRQPDLRRAFTQFLALYGFLGSEALVYLLPAPSDCQLQDLVFTANLGVVLGHLRDRDVVVLSNFTSPARRGETEVGQRFFRALGYALEVPPSGFEGEADLKHLHDGVYVGGYGIRSERATWEWMEQRFGMTVIPVALRDPHLHHLDQSLFPITREQTLICTELFEREEIRELEKHTELIEVSRDDAYAGICSSVRLSNVVLNGSSIHRLGKKSAEYALELHKNRRLEDIATALALEVSYFDLGEYRKSGALLSSMLMHLNRHAYSIARTP